MKESKNLIKQLIKLQLAGKIDIILIGQEQTSKTIFGELLK